jgi:NAD(P) transhydrogenase subunit alpha
MCAADASRMWARNVLGFAELLGKEGKLAPQWDDEIVKACCVTRDGEVVHEGARKAVQGGAS